MSTTRALQLQKIQKKLIVILMALFVLSLVTYGYFVNQTVLYAASQGDLESEIASLRAKLATAESSYVQLQKTITHEYAYNLGFINIEDTHFIAREPTNAVVALQQ